MPKIITIGAWTLRYTDGFSYGTISHAEFGDCEVIGYGGQKVSAIEMATDLEMFIRDNAANYIVSLLQSA